MGIQGVTGVIQQPQQIQQNQQAPQVQVQPQLDIPQKPEYVPVEKVSYEPVETARGAKAISEEAVQKNLESLKELLKAKETNITLEYDNLSSPRLVNILDAESGNVIRQIPAPAVVEIAQKARDYIIGLMIDKKV